MSVVRRVVICVVVGLVLVACTRSETTATSETERSTTSTSSSTTTSTYPKPPSAPAPAPQTIASWKIVGETASTPPADHAITCFSPDPPASCVRLDGPIDLGGYGTGNELVGVRVHLSPVSFSDEQFAANLTAAYSSCACRITDEVTAAGRRAWVMSGSTRSGVFEFLVTRLNDTAYASVIRSCGFGPCPAPFPVDHARALIADLVPTQITMQLLHWLGPVESPDRTLRIPVQDRACDSKYRSGSVNPTLATYAIAEHVVVLLPPPTSDLAQQVCIVGGL